MTAGVRSVLCLLSMVGSVSLAALTPDLLRSARAIPPHVAGVFREPAGFQRAASGGYFVFDRRGHSVFGIDEEFAGTRRIVTIGAEPGRIIEPTAFSVASDGTFVVADAPNNRERVQIFTPEGVRLGGFLIRGRSKPRVVLNNFVIGGVGSVQFTGTSILLSEPETDALFSEYTLAGNINRLIGTLRATGHERDDPEVHVALNTGLPLVDPTGGFFFVFVTGEPIFRKYDAAGRLQFERRMIGREIDDVVASLPTTWPRRKTSEGELPLITPTIRTAAVDRAGRLWVSFVVPYTYVFDAEGDKVRVLQFQGAGLIAPNSFFFDQRGRLLVTPGLYEFEP